MNQNNEKMQMQIVVMDAVRFVSLKKGMLVLGDLPLELIHALIE